MAKLTADQRSSMPKSEFADAKLGTHPREHSLAMASATSLHKAGYISTAHKEAIHKQASKKLDVHKKAKTPSAYGSLAPQSAGHYLSTVNPGAAEDDQGGI